jgi:hypothetical protein
MRCHDLKVNIQAQDLGTQHFWAFSSFSAEVSSGCFLLNSVDQKVVVKIQGQPRQDLPKVNCQK